MPLPEVVAAVDRLKARLLALDEAAAAELVAAYTPIWGRLRREIDGILADVAERQMTLDQALRLQRLHALQAQVEREMARYTTVAVGTATNAQRAAVELAASSTRQAVAAALPPGVDMRLLASIGIDWNLLPADAFEALVGIAGDGGPLRALLEPLGAVARDGIAQGLAEGIALGRGPRETAALIRDRFGMPLTRSLTISRTETLRAFRGATRMQYQANRGVVKGYVRRAAQNSATCPACFVDYKVPILTSSGFKPIGKIGIGELVLTHKGQFRKVTHIFKQPVSEANIITITSGLSGGPQYNSLTMTIEHPVLTQRGWVRADALTLSDHIAVPTKPCDECGKPIPFRYWGKHGEPKTCSTRCTGRRGAKGLHGNLRAHHQAVQNMIWTHWRMFANGSHPFQRLEIRQRATRNALRANSLLVSSKTEGVLGKAFDSLGLQYETQYPIESHYNKKRGRFYNYFADFAFPSEKLIVEADGEPWHSWDAKRIEHDRVRQERIEKQGWTVLRYSGSQIHANMQGIAEEVQAILRNHNGEYGIMWTEIKGLKYGVRKPPSPSFKVVRYNLEVEEDNSYVAKFAVVHNCIALDGTEHETADILPTHPACRCVAVPRVVSYRDLGLDVDEPERPVEGARDWFERQPAAMQRATLGPGRFAAWREGRLALMDMATVRDNATWGPTVSVTPLMGR